LFAFCHLVNSILIAIDCTGCSLHTSGTLVSIIVLLCVDLQPHSVTNASAVANIVIAASDVVDSVFIVRSFSEIKNNQERAANRCPYLVPFC